MHRGFSVFGHSSIHAIPHRPHSPLDMCQIGRSLIPTFRLHESTGNESRNEKNLHVVSGINILQALPSNFIEFYAVPCSTKSTSGNRGDILVHELGRIHDCSYRGQLGRGSNDLGRGMLKYKLFNP